MSAYNQNIRQFLTDAASSSPTPGGGSIAALAAALGASMGAMVANLTTGPKFAAAETQMIALAGQMNQAIGEFEHLIREDIDSFQAYMNALGMPKSSPEEKAARSSALMQAAAAAAEVPFRLMSRCVGLMRLLGEAAGQVNKNVASDHGIALIMLEAAVQSAWLTAEINLPGMKNDELSAHYREQGGAWIAEARLLKERCLTNWAH
ncbi:cyclodeaminase/cyclohydrolase family protein [Paenibacillus thalictri]|nr:cyclodeaminase/cyclohydrolase family protein [Paenibacillus thalictri]